ncbi:unnamed protein product [Paramecium octaurelia]|uniref:Uncharacterized protein n=1 Tax=Paramecium octaurelia TaxID=43137 RepID=A0A8S1SCM8_PAROT|nr:unnamed protein product [Paramecium octaurelia]
MFQQFKPLIKPQKSILKVKKYFQIKDWHYFNSSVMTKQLNNLTKPFCQIQIIRKHITTKEFYQIGYLDLKKPQNALIKPFQLILNMLRLILIKAFHYHLNNCISKQQLYSTKHWKYHQKISIFKNKKFFLYFK